MQSVLGSGALGLFDEMPQADPALLDGGGGFSNACKCGSVKHGKEQG
jgi:hypothetical protein